MSEDYSIALGMLIQDDIALEANDMGVEQPLSERILQKVQRAFQKIIKTLMMLVDKLLSAFKWLGRKFSHQLQDKTSGITFVEDRFGYIDTIKIVSPVIDEYTQSLMNLKDLDHEINKSYSLMDDLKKAVKNGAIGRTNEPSIREYHERVIRNLRDADDYRLRLYSSLDRMENNPTELDKPRKFDLDFILKFVRTTFDSKTSVLEDIKSELKDSADMYRDRKFMYKRKHKEDIERNQKILDHTSYLLVIIGRYKNLYSKFMVENDVHLESGR